MKKIATTFCCFIIACSTAYGQSELNEVRDMIGPAPTLNRVITERMYHDTVRLKDLQLMSGTLVAQSKLPGTSAAITEKGVTVNAGSRIFALHNVRRFSVQGILTGQSEEGFVSVFKDGTYQRTLGAGVSVNCFYFGPLKNPENTFYRPDAARQEKAHRQLREEVSIHLATKCSHAPVAITSNALALCALLKARPALFNQLRDKAAVLDSCAALSVTGINPSPDTAAQTRLRTRRRYQGLIGGVAILLPSKWAEMRPDSAAAWVTANLCDSLVVRQRYQAKQYKGFIRRIDSLQLANVIWKHRQLRWLSFRFLGNTEQQPIYDAAAALFTNKQQFAFQDVRLSLNNAYIRRKVRYFFAQGVGYNSQRRFDPAELLIYQKVNTQTLPPATPSNVTVEESKFYLQAPARPDYLVLDGQGSLFWTKMRLGLDATIKYKWDRKAPDQTTATVGLFLPILAAESSINFMVQEKWDTLTKWTTGFNLAASIPGFLTSKK